MNHNCKNCGNPITIQIFKGGDWCSENCRKALLKKLIDYAEKDCEYTTSTHEKLQKIMHYPVDQDGAWNTHDPHQGSLEDCNRCHAT